MTDTNLFGDELPRLGHPLFRERWDNRKAFWIGVYAGQGYSGPAIEEELGEHGTANTITHMCNMWGFRLPEGRYGYGEVTVRLHARFRTAHAREARERKTTMPDLFAQILTKVAQDDLWRAILD